MLESSGVGWEVNAGYAVAVDAEIGRGFKFFRCGIQNLTKRHSISMHFRLNHGPRRSHENNQLVFSICVCFYFAFLLCHI